MFGSRKLNFFLLLTGLSLTGLFGYLTVMSVKFNYELPIADKPVLTYVAVLIAAGFLYLLSAKIVTKTPWNKRALVWVLVVGFSLRGLMFLSSPILEDDIYRYMWDGAVTANGLNPYAYSPDVVLGKSETNYKVPPAFIELKREAGSVVDRVNHSQYRSIYPPVTQGVFALAYYISPWNVNSLRSVFLIFDIMTAIILLLILQKLKLPPLLLTVYWWNPILIKEIYNSAHMDIVAVALVIAAMYLAVCKRHVLSFSSLAFAVGAKLWPVILLPLLLKRTFDDKEPIFPPLIIFVLLISMIFIPVIVFGIGGDSGYSVYAQMWSNNESAFKILLWMSESLLEAVGVHPGHGQVVARYVFAGLVLLLTLYLSFKRQKNDREMFDRALLIIGIVYLLSPTQFPWYYVWLLPFLAVNPRGSFLILAALLPLYYVQYYLTPTGGGYIADNVIVWFEFVPVWILLLREWVEAKRKRGWFTTENMSIIAK